MKRNAEPSSGHKLAALVSQLHPALRRNAKAIRSHLESHRPLVASLAGPAGADWAIDQLSTAPFVVKGWAASTGKRVRA